MIKKLRKKFIIIATVSVALAMVILSVIVNTANFISTDKRLGDTLQMICDNQGTIPTERTAPPDAKGARPDAHFNKETPFSTRYFVLRYKDDGTLVMSNMEKIAAVTSDDAQKYLSIAYFHGEGFGYADNFGYKFLVVKTGGNKNMVVFLDCQNEMQSVKTILLLSSAATVFCVLVVYLLVVLFSKKAIDPVVKSNERQKQFITDASHELKTPITVINTSLTVLEMDVGKQKWIDKALAQTDKLKGLVDSLVSLSRMDEEQPQVLCDFNISDAVYETAESFADFAKEKGHEIVTDIENDIVFKGNEYSVRQLISILTDNAVKYASVGSPIEISLKKSKRGVVIKCANLCENVDESELSKLFDRFYRGDKSRSSKGGYGIGLSLAKSICEAHKGDIFAKKIGENKIEFTAELKV